MPEISLKVTAGPAYREIAKLDAALKKLSKNGGGSSGIRKKPTDRLRKAIARSVAIHTAITWDFLMEQTPYWSGYLVSNWGLSQGRDPGGRLINAKNKWDKIMVVGEGEYEFPAIGQFDAPEINLDDIDGTKYQVIYNNTPYAISVSEGVGPTAKNDYKIVSGGGPDWFLTSGAFFVDPGVYRRHFNEAVRDVNLG